MKILQQGPVGPKISKNLINGIALNFKGRHVERDYPLPYRNIKSSVMQDVCI